MGAGCLLDVDALPVTVSRFIQDHFDTISSVEVLLFLQRQRAHRWSSQAVARELHLDQEQADGILSRLDRGGLVHRHGPDFQYAPRTDETAHVVQQLADHYSRYRSRIVTLVFSGERPDSGRDQGDDCTSP